MDGILVVVIAVSLILAASANVCPPNCQCDVITRAVTCRGLDLADVPQNLPNTTVSLDLRDNAIRELTNASFETYPLLRSLNLERNRISRVDNDTFIPVVFLQQLILQDNLVPSLDVSHLNYLMELNLAKNRISCLQVPQSVVNLNLSSNAIKNLTKVSFSKSALSVADFSSNSFSTIPAFKFINAPHLRVLKINNGNLYHINATAFTGLKSLQILEIRDNPKFPFIHKDLFRDLTNLRTLDLSNNNISSFYAEAYQSLSSLNNMTIQGNPLVCNCALKWLQHTKINILNPNQTLCSGPDFLKSEILLHLSPDNLTCTPPRILNYTQQPFFRVGSQAVLKCIADGEPRPLVRWKAPNGRVFVDNNYLEDQWNQHPSKETVLDKLYHSNGEMQAVSHKYMTDIGPTRIQLLSNGDLFISYVLRSDAGPYVCEARNPGGNDTVTFTFLLNYTIIKDVTVASMIVGFSSAGIFFGFGLLVALVRYLGNKCAERHRKRSRRIKKIIGHLDSYRSNQIMRLRESYGGHYGKIKEHLIGQMDKMRENYFSQIARIQDKCATRMDHLRENYSTQMGKIKGYSGHQIEHVRDSYSNQMIKIRDYGSTQLEKLRESYKLQHQHLLKILEVISIDNCRGMTDSECMKANSVLFDTKFTLDNLDINLDNLTLDHLDSKASSRNSLCISEDFLTATSDPDGISMSELRVHEAHEPSPNLHVHREAEADLALQPLDTEDEEMPDDRIFVIEPDDPIFVVDMDLDSDSNHDQDIIDQGTLELEGLSPNTSVV